MKPQNTLKLAQDICTEGINLGQQGKREEALTQYTAVITQFGAEQDIEFLKVLAVAMFNTGTTLAALDRNEEAVTAYHALIEKFDEHIDAKLQLYVVKAMMNKAYRLNTLLRNDEAIASYETVIAKFGTTQDPETVPYIDSVKSFLDEHSAVLEARAKNGA
jgi:tetratricopeptide (TPR) repeat protein